MDTNDAAARDFAFPLVGALFAVVSTLSGAAVALAAGWPAAFLASGAAGLVAYFVLAAFRGRREGARKAGRTLKSGTDIQPRAMPAAHEIPADRIDALTGLANQNGLNAWFAERGPRLAADGKGIVVIVARLDDFEPIIRARGQAVADAVLVEVALRVAMVAGEEGIAARTDGEEFASVVAVVPNRSEAIATERAGQLLEMVGRPVEHPSGAVWIGGSVGAASGSPLDGDGTLVRARRALATAVKLGRGQCVVDAQRG